MIHRWLPAMLVVVSFSCELGQAQEEDSPPPTQDESAQEPDEEENAEELFDDGLDELLDDGLDELLDDGLDDFLEEGDSPAQATRSSLRDWKGFFELRPKLYYRDRDEDKNNEQLVFEAELEMDFQVRDNVDGYFRPRVLVDLFDGDLKRFEPYEAYLTYRGDSFDVRGGQFVENWGIVDTYNPIDVVNRRDYASDILDADRLGEFGLRFRKFFESGDTIGEPTLSFYALPVWRETLFAPEDQRFSFDNEDFRFEEDEGFEPEGEERPFLAMRYASTLETSPANADIQFLASRGPDRLPAIVPDPQGVLRPAYFGAWTFGAGFRAVPNLDAAGEFLSTLTLKAEIVYKDPYEFDDSPIEEPDDYVAYVLGIDREFYSVFTDQDQFTTTVEYAREDGADDPTALLRPFRDDIILRLFWQPNDFARTSLELRGIYDLDHGETIVESIFERQLRFIDEDLKFIAQLQIFESGGDDESLFEFFPNNSSLAIGLRLDF